MKVYQYDKDGYYIGITEDYGGAMPHKCTTLQPEPAKEKHKLKFDGSKWLSEEIPIPEAEEGKQTVWNREKQEYEQIELPPSIEQMQEWYIVLLKHKRNTCEKFPLLYDSNYFDYDDDSRSRINEAISFMERNQIGQMTWTLADNSTTEVSANDMYAVKDSAAQRSALLHDEYNRLKLLLNQTQNEQHMQEILDSAFAKTCAKDDRF